MTEKRWAANEKAPLTREQQIELMETAEQRREEKLKRWSKIDWSEKTDNFYREDLDNG
jgi:hypothetical protein